MSFDPFIFTPCSLDDLNIAIERAQKAAVVQAVAFYRDIDRASSSEFASAVQNARHLTAIQRATRTMGGALFDPDSKLSPAQRHDLFMRRVERVEAAYARATGAPHVPTRSQTSTSTPHTPGTPSASSASSSSSNPVNLVNPVDDPSPPGDFKLNPPRPSDSSDPSDPSDSSDLSTLSPALASLDPDYCPPNIEDLLSAVELLTKCSGDRWGRINEHPYRATPEDRRFEMLALKINPVD
jgi:hypothetical protein